MWALGVTAHILLGGTMPFEDDDRTAVPADPQGQVQFLGEPWPSVSSLAPHFIDRLPTADPGARMTDCRP
ncbi:hypothetical protein QTO34_009817 [Cnephaeus nilssonii]|uniref:Protein kinase domain-containing protein n=1 Tax=Cnephaeus nilssonii TaxID=3371016 RepID=A0AA40HE73_CNENI|nr:hypothetical protein QTO34_009817 [Eptesicus nilssonii]